MCNNAGYSTTTGHFVDSVTVHTLQIQQNQTKPKPQPPFMVKFQIYPDTTIQFLLKNYFPLRHLLLAHTLLFLSI